MHRFWQTDRGSVGNTAHTLAQLAQQPRTEDEVLSQLRLHGIEDFAHIHRACIEPNSMVGVILQQPQETSDSPKHLGP